MAGRIFGGVDGGGKKVRRVNSLALSEGAGFRLRVEIPMEHAASAFRRGDGFWMGNTRREPEAGGWRGDTLRMNPGELPTRLTIVLALGAYAVGAVAVLRARGRAGWLTRARWAWTLGCALLLVHVACAFGFYHGWSHGAAYADTARQTAAVTGLRWGGGLFVNYIFTLGWVADVLWWWWDRASYERRPGWLNIAWHAFVVFLIFNATVVFGGTAARWFGSVLCLALAIAWLWPRR